MVSHRKLDLGVKRDGPQKVMLKPTIRLLQMKEWPQATPCFMPYLVLCIRVTWDKKMPTLALCFPQASIPSIQDQI